MDIGKILFTLSYVKYKQLDFSWVSQKLRPKTYT